MDRIRDNAPPLTSRHQHQDMRKDTTPTTDARQLDAASTTEDARTIDAQEQTAATVTTSTPATSGHIEAQEPQQLTQGKKRRKDNTSAAAHIRYMSKSYDRMELQLIKGDKERLRAAAAKLDISPTALIIRAVNAYTDAETLTEKAKNPYI